MWNINALTIGGISKSKEMLETYDGWWRETGGVSQIGKRKKRETNPNLLLLVLINTIVSTVCMF